MPIDGADVEVEAKSAEQEASKRNGEIDQITAIRTTHSREREDPFQHALRSLIVIGPKEIVMASGSQH